MSTNPRFIEVYSGNRNRMIYPSQSSFVIPFSQALQNFPTKNYLDQVINGSIYLSFSLSSKETSVIKGTFQYPIRNFIFPPYPQTYRFAYLYVNQNSTGIVYGPIPGFLTEFQFTYSLIPNYYKGYNILNTTTNESNIINSYNPSTGLITFDRPFSNPITPGDFYSPGDGYSIFPPYPTQNYIFIPYIDVNYNVSLDYEGSYNGYYIVFESPNPNYSNADNSNIFYKKISYYDSKYRLAYFDTPLDFNYEDTTSLQEFTIRKSPPLERWTLDKATYNNTITKDPLIGPLVGTIITLPSSASNIDNYYKGKYVYFASNQADSYDPPYPNPDTLDTPIPNTFYPIYGIYYINAYNGTTKELSVCQDLNDISCEFTRNSFNPPTYKILDYNSGSFGEVDFFYPVDLGGGVYEAASILGFPCCPVPGTLVLTETLYETGRKYKLTITVKDRDMLSPSFFEIIGASQSYVSPKFSNTYTTIETVIVPIKQKLFLRFYMDYDINAAFDGLINPAIIWNFFQMETVDIINICDFKNENATPLNYNGSIVSQNETVCYEISLLGLTIPNVPLLTGSRIAFYPYVYVEISNLTSPNKASTGIIYSNNPESKRALFIAPVGQVARPNLGTFLTLSSSMKQTIKFKPNDSLQFRVFLPDGQLIQPLLPDIFSPYAPDPRLQIGALFSILRVGRDSNDFRNKIDRIKI